MKTLSILVLTLTIFQIYGEKQEKRSNVAFQNEDYKEFNLNKGEFYPSPEDKFNDELKGFDENYGYKVKQKVPFKSQIQNGDSHYESLRPEAVQPVKKYVVKKPESFQVQDTQKGMKFTSSVGKPMKMKAKVVQKGSVKHIYLDIPDHEPLPQPSMPKGYRYTSPNYHHQFENNNYFNKQPIHHQSFSHGGFNHFGGNFGPQQSFGHGFGAVSSGFRVGKAQNQPSIKGLGTYSTYGSQFEGGIKYPPPQYNKFKPISPPEHIFGNNFNHLQQYAAPQSYQQGSFAGHQIDQQINHQIENFGGSQQQALSQGEHQFEGESGGDFGSGYNFPEYSPDGKDKYMYVIPKEYQHLFANNGGQSGLDGQSTGHIPKATTNFALDHQPQQQQFQYDFGKETNPFEQQQLQQQQFQYDFGKGVNQFEQQKQQSQQQLQYDFGKGVNQFEQQKQQSQQQHQYGFGAGANQFDQQKPQQQLQFDFGKGGNQFDQSEFIAKATNLYSTQPQNFNSGKQHEVGNFQQNEFLPQPSQLVQFPQPQQFETFKQSESINNQNFGGTTNFVPKPAPEQYNTQQQQFGGNFEASKSIAEYGQSTEFMPKVASNFQFNTQQLDATQKTPGLENVSGFDPDLVNIVNNVINKGEGIPTNNGFRVVKSNENNAIYLVGKPGMSLDAVPNFGGFKPSDFQLNNGNTGEKAENSNSGKS